MTFLEDKYYSKVDCWTVIEPKKVTEGERVGVRIDVTPEGGEVNLSFVDNTQSN